MKTIIALCLCFSTLCLFAVPCESATTGMRLLETGQFHGDEVQARTGERWLGLYVWGERSALVSSVVTVGPVHDPVIDATPNERTGKEVSVRRSGKPVFLLKGARGLRPGPVRTSFAGAKSLGNAETVPLSLGDKKYRLRVVSDDPEPASHLAQNSRLILASGGRTQVLFHVAEHGDASWSLLWAGDLDGDGELDLYLDLNTHYNTSQRRLFLSTRAARRSLVKEVAVFTVVGC